MEDEECKDAGAAKRHLGNCWQSGVAGECIEVRSWRIRVVALAAIPSH